MRRTIIALVVVMSLLLSSCSAEPTAKDENPDYYISGILIEIDRDNPYGLRSMAWPDYYIVENIGTFEMEGVSKDISVKDKNYLISYVDSLPAAEFREDEEPLCSITLELWDYYHGGRVYLVHIYDEYPEDFGEFAEVLLRICRRSGVD